VAGLPREETSDMGAFSEDIERDLANCHDWIEVEWGDGAALGAWAATRFTSLLRNQISPP
jgi:hypothetical protein